jgi:3-oxoacyl-[acyl-carrier-protein] synthase II
LVIPSQHIGRVYYLAQAVLLQLLILTLHLFKTQFACELKNFDPLDHLDRKEARKYDRFAQYALVSVAEALEDAALPLEKVDKDRVGVIWGAGIGGLETFQNEVLNFAASNENPRFNPFLYP